MKRLVECVPNFSEGRDRSVIDAIAERIRSSPGVPLLDVAPGASDNRPEVTFVGDPEHVVEAAFRAAATAYRLIDMRQHHGEHPRLGAVDVVPFVPVSGVTMAECVALAGQFGERVGRELGIPVYLYEEAQPLAYRKELRQIRQGEYEGLAERITQADWAPDYGPAEFVPRSGATVTGARFFLIAYNVNILGTGNQAHRLALDIREQGRTVTDPDGTERQQPGRFRAVKAIGWELAQYGLAQVSVSLDNYRVTPMHAVYEAIREGARALKVGVAGSEIVGLVPREAVLMAADHYIEQEHLFILDERQKIRLAVDRLGLSSLHPFKPEEKIIEYLIEQEPEGPLASMSVRDFVAAVGARTSAPGGGSVSALMGALGAALGAMVGWLTYGRRKFEHLDEVMRTNIPPLVEIQKELLLAVDQGTEAFEDYLKALALPKETEEERAARQDAMQAGLKQATMVPFRTMELVARAWEPLRELARPGQYSSRSDVEVGATALEAAAYGAHRNVAINLAGIRDEAFVRELQERSATLLARAKELARSIADTVEARSGDA
ncbi:MAG: glutamate formimidoyltransferase [Gemmatimonadetes bacterium]|nr:glutamate formimidoyltransferase [Gemmatimonadota bacterium]